MMIRQPDPASTEEHAAFFRDGAMRNQAKLERLIARGRRISDQLLADAAAFRARIDAIDQEYPETG